MIEQDIIFHITKDKKRINVKVEINIEYAIIILETLYDMLEKKGYIESEETKKEIEA